MTSDPFYQEESRVLTPTAFEFVLGNELRRAVRSQNFLTLIVMDAEPEPVSPAAQAEPLRQIARLVSHELRETDVLAHTPEGKLSVVLLDADLDNSMRVIDRLMSRIDHYDFPTPLSIEIGAACCPTHAVDAESLLRIASTQPMLSRHRGAQGSET
jgi:PleD family two-component response regulator